MSLIVDASIAVKWFVEEQGSEAARSLVGEELSAPDLLLAETFNALDKRVRRKTAPPETLEHVIELLRGAITDLMPIGHLVGTGAALSVRLRHPIYDCLYLALAERQGATLVTADERQFAAARKARIPARLL